MKKIGLALCILISLFSNHFNAQTGLAFNGSSNSVTTSVAPVLNNLPRTVDAWIKTTSAVTSQLVICDWGAMSPNGSRFTLNLINSKLRIEVGGVGFAGTTNLNTGQWFHVTAVYSPSISVGANVFLYVNGVLEASGNFTGYSVLATSSAGGFRIGVRNDGINFFPGSIDEVKVYNYDRTQAQVAADTVEYCTPQPGLVAYYKLNEGIPNGTNTGSTTAIDYSGNGNNGTLNSFSLTGSASNWVTGRVRSSAPTISISPSTNICIGTALNFSTNATTNFTWSTGNTNSNPIAVTPSVSGTYSISVTNSLNCTTSSFVTVSNSPPNVTVVATQNSICLGASTSFSANGASTYSWSGGITNGQVFSPTVTSTYSLAAGNGCGLVNSVHTITVAPLQITTLANPSLVCEGSNCSLAAVASANGFTWSPGGQTGSTITITPFSNAVYTVAATDGTCVGTQTVQITTKTTPSISVSNTFVTLCEGVSTSITASGAGNNGSYLWSPGGSILASITVTPNATINYTVVGTNSLGCSSSAQIPILVLASPVFTVSASNTLVCNGQSIVLAAGGANTYTWSSGATTASTSVIPSFAYSVYSVSATSSNNTCTATQTVAIAVITPSVTYTSSVSICNGSSAILTATGANTYTWNNLPVGTSAQQVFSPTITTTYTLIANTQSLTTSCLSTHFSTVIVNPNPVVLAVASITQTICNGITNTLTASGANTYTWSGINLTTAQIIVTPSVSTTYTVVGITNDGCQNTAQIQVKVNACTGVFEHTVGQEFNLYPNPANEQLTISSELEMVLEMYTIKGQLMKTIRINNGTTRIDVSDLTKGLYLFKAQGQSFSLCKKIVIQ